MDTSNPSGWVIAGPAPFRQVSLHDNVALSRLQVVKPLGALAVPSEIDWDALYRMQRAVEAAGYIVTLNGSETTLNAGLTFELWEEA